MPEFRYIAYNQQGRKVRGTLTAGSQETAMSNLTELNLYVMNLKVRPEEPWWKRDIITLGQPVKGEEFAAFCRQFATLLQAGVSVLESVRILSSQTESKRLSQTLNKVFQELRTGKQLSEAVQVDPDVFPPMFVNLVRAGEMTGSLDEALDRLATYFEKAFYTREKVKSALAYPIFVGILAVAVTIFVLVKIVPTYATVFASYHAALPLPTRIVMNVSRGVSRGWWIICLFVLAIIVIDRYAIRKPRYRWWRDTLLLHIPVVGKMFRKVLMVRMSRTMGSLIASAVPILDGINVVRDVVANEVLAATMEQSATSLRQGLPLASAFTDSKIVPPMVAEMIAVGERSGNLETMLTKIADFYDTEVEANADRLKSLLEPIMILILAFVVGTIVLAVLLPSFSLLSQLR